MFATADNWSRLKYFFPDGLRRLTEGSWACTRISWWTRNYDRNRIISCAFYQDRRVFRRASRRWVREASARPWGGRTRMSADRSSSFSHEAQAGSREHARLAPGMGSSASPPGERAIRATESACWCARSLLATLPTDLLAVLGNRRG